MRRAPSAGDRAAGERAGAALVGADDRDCRGALRHHRRYRRVRERPRPLRRPGQRRHHPAGPLPDGGLGGLQQRDAAGRRDRERRPDRGGRHPLRRRAQLRDRYPEGHRLEGLLEARGQWLRDDRRHHPQDRRGDLHLRGGHLHHLPLPGRGEEALGDPRQEGGRRGGGIRHHPEHQLRHPRGSR